MLVLVRLPVREDRGAFTEAASLGEAEVKSKEQDMPSECLGAQRLTGVLAVTP